MGEPRTEALVHRNGPSSKGRSAVSAKAKLRELLASAGLTQRQAAQHLGVSQRTLQYWLADSSPHAPPPMALDALRWYLVDGRRGIGMLRL